MPGDGPGYLGIIPIYAAIDGANQNAEPATGHTREARYVMDVG